MKKIMFDHQIFAEQVYGGISRYFYEITRRIKCIGKLDVKIFAPLYINRYVREEDGMSIIGKRMPQLPKTTRSMMVINNYATRFFIKKYQPDVIHETYYHLKSPYSPNIPTVTTVHDMIYEKMPQYFGHYGSTIIEKKRLAVNRASHVICVSRNTQKDLIEQLNVDPARTSVIYHGVSEVFGREKIDSSPAIKDPYVLFVGHRDGYKNFKNFLKAWTRSRRLASDFQVVCFGGGPFKPHEMAWFKEHGLNPKNIIQLSGDDLLLNALYQNAKCFSFPSFYEGFGLPVLEAMACNCPVAASNESALPEVAGNAAAYFNPREIDSIIEALEGVLYDEEKKKTLIERGRQRVKAFSWEKAAMENNAVYEQLG